MHASGDREVPGLFLLLLEPYSGRPSWTRAPASRRVPAHPRCNELAGFWKGQGFSIRIANALGNAGMMSLEDLRRARREAGLQMPILGKTGRKQVEAFLDSHT